MTFMTTLKRLLYQTSGLIIKGAKYNPKQIKSNNIDAKSVAISQHEDSIAIEAKGNPNQIMQATKKISELTDTDKKIVQSLISAIFNNESIAKPVYCPEVMSEADASSKADSLPLIYIWNEDKVKRSFSISVNGLIVGAILEQKVDRSDPSFVLIRDEVMQVLRNATQSAVVSACEHVGAMPSVVFGR